jgi:hypothetical protein
VKLVKRTELDKPYEPTPEERSAAKTLYGRSKRTPRLRTSKKEGATEISVEHPNQFHGYALLMNALGITEPDFMTGILSQLGNAVYQGSNTDDQALNFLICAMKGIEPKDQLETMLAAQMAAVHMLTMKYARLLNQVDNIPQQDSAERTFNKLGRTFASQMEALKRYRTGGEQKVTVEHVTVNQGGQAIVGNVTGGGPGSTKKPGTTS